MRIRRFDRSHELGQSAFDSPDPIDAYLDVLRRSLCNQADRDDLVGEAEDHLREAVARLTLAGAEPTRAHELALNEFGDATLVARALVRTRLRTVPLASPVSRACGVLGCWAGVAWLVALTVNLYQITAEPWLVEQYVWFQLACSVASLLSVALIIGLLARAGALRSVSTPVAVLLTIVAATGNATMSWMWPVTNPLVGIALWIALLECRRAGIGLGSGPIQLAALIWPLATVAAVVGRVLEIGPVDDWGEHSMLYEWAFPSAAGLFAVACWLIGSDLAAERVADLAPRGAPPLAAVARLPDDGARTTIEAVGIDAASTSPTARTPSASHPSVGPCRPDVEQRWAPFPEAE